MQKKYPLPRPKRPWYNPMAKVLERLRKSGEKVAIPSEADPETAYAALVRLHRLEPDRRTLCLSVHGLTGPRHR